METFSFKPSRLTRPDPLPMFAGLHFVDIKGTTA
jgi:hypothetical protein